MTMGIEGGGKELHILVEQVQSVAISFSITSCSKGSLMWLSLRPFAMITYLVLEKNLQYS